MASSPESAKRIILSGCTGFVGRELVPRLEALQIDLLLVGRDARRVEALFPGREVCDYASLAEAGRGYDRLVHLAALNNDSGATEAQFEAVNVEFTLSVAQAALAAGVADFIHVSSFHALDARRTDGYSRSKRLASRRLAQVEGLCVTDLFLPAVYSSQWSGRLRHLHSLPSPLRSPTFSVLAALRPTVHVEKVAAFLACKEHISGSRQVILADDQDLNPTYRLVKRAIDLMFAFGVALLLNWLLLACWALIRIESRGPGIFAQPRIGRHGKIFTCYKFRTMEDGTRQAASHEVSSTSVTRMGRFMRRTKIDELPQIWNIWRNEMSLIGPRPCLPMQQEVIEERRARGVLIMKPGISGYAQVHDVDMSDPSRLAETDSHYRMLRCLPLDLYIIVATIAGRGQGDKVRVT